MSARLVISREAVEQNFRTVLHRAGQAKVWWVLKGNAYGMGLEPTARALSEWGADRFAVTEPEEAETLRRAGAAGEILLLRSTVLEEELACALRAGATVTVGSREAALAAEAVAAREGAILPVQAEFDVGMGRGGFAPEAAGEIPAMLAECPHLRLTGIYAHPNRAFAEEKYTREALARLQSAGEAMAGAGLAPGEMHLCDSVALFRFPWARLDAVRVGSALTGGLLAGDRSGLARVARAECAVSEVHTLAPGQSAGYGFGFTAQKPIRVAVVPMGYADGAFVRREKDTRRLKDRLVALRGLVKGRAMAVEIGGEACPVVGYVGMKHLLCDVTGRTVAPGDVARIPVDPVLAGQILTPEWE